MTSTPPRPVRRPSRRACLAGFLASAALSAVTPAAAGGVVSDETPTPTPPEPTPPPPGGRSAMPLYDGPPVPGPFDTPRPPGRRRPKPPGGETPEGSVGGSPGK